MGTHPIFESDFDCLTDLIGQMVQVHRLVERFDQKGSGKRDSQCFLDDEPAEKLGKTQIEERKFLADCEQDIRGIVKKVVKFFNEFAERNIQSKQKKILFEKRKRLKVRLKQKLKEPVPPEECTRLNPELESKNQLTVATLPYVDPVMQWRNSLRMPIPEWTLL